jgi:hypothetical protein
LIDGLLGFRLHGGDFQQQILALVIIPAKEGVILRGILALAQFA